MEAPKEIADDPRKLAVFTDAADKVVPDPAVYSEWFDEADERRRRLAVGSRRYSLVQDRLGREPAWADFLDPKTGELATLDRLKREGADVFAARSQAATQLIADRKADIERISTFGFEPPALPPFAAPVAAPTPTPPRPPVQPRPVPAPAAPAPAPAQPGQPVDPLRGHPQADKTRDERIKWIGKYSTPAKPETFAYPPAPEKVQVLGPAVVDQVRAAIAADPYRRPTIQQLYGQLRATNPDLTILQFQSLLRQLQLERKLLLGAYTQAPGLLTDQELLYAMPLDTEIKMFVGLWR